MLGRVPGVGARESAISSGASSVGVQAWLESPIAFASESHPVSLPTPVAAPQTGLIKLLSA